jgi:hypothetical protein
MKSISMIICHFIPHKDYYNYGGKNVTRQPRTHISMRNQKMTVKREIETKETKETKRRRAKTQRSSRRELEEKDSIPKYHSTHPPATTHGEENKARKKRTEKEDNKFLGRYSVKFFGVDRDMQDARAGSCS